MIDPTLEDDLAVQRKRRHRWISILVILGLIALGDGVWWLTHRTTETGAAGQGAGPGGGPGGPGGPGGGRRGGVATTVGIAVAETADMPVMLEALGTVTPIATTTVVPQVSGTILKVLYREGQLVKAGDVLVTIDPKSYEIARMQAEGNLQRDQANLESAHLTLTRYQTLLKQDSIAGQDADTQAALVKQLEGTVVTDRAALNAAKLNLSYTNITAPISGRLGLRVVDVGNYVTAGTATGVAVITVMDPIDVEFSLPQDLIPSLMKRLVVDKATLPTTALDRTRVNTLATGHFLTLDNRVDTTTGTVKGKAQFSNKEATLFPNQFVNVRIQADTLKNVVVVPAGAVRQGASGQFVYVLDTENSTVSMRTIKTGQADGDRIVVKEGLQSGETVITEGADRLKEGAKVKMPAAKPAAAAGGDKPKQHKKKHPTPQP
jgi:multidrug efflux system membrane fusion protein